MADLKTLADRIELLEEPSREIDSEIYGIIVAELWPNYEPFNPLHAMLAPKYTASLDAAIDLVPEGYDWIIGRVNGGLTIYAEVGGRGDDFTRYAATPALALVSGALRAMIEHRGAGDE